MNKIFNILLILLLFLVISCSSVSQRPIEKPIKPAKITMPTESKGYVNKQVYIQPEDVSIAALKPELTPELKPAVNTPSPVVKQDARLDFDDFYKLYMGKTISKDDVLLSLGEPNLITKEGNNQLWRFDTLDCRLSLFWLGSTLGDVMAYSSDVKEYGTDDCYKEVYNNKPTNKS